MDPPKGSPTVSDRWVKLELDASTFDAARFERYLERCRSAGIRLTTLADLGDTPPHRRALYELNKECSADIPGRGEFYTFDEYLKRRIEVPSYDPRGVVVALDGDTWCGLAATSDWRTAGFVFNEMTGVRTPYRSQGLSVAMKTYGIEFARLCGVDKIRTVHHPENMTAIEMNRRLGYVDAEWD
ncbi:GNAT family N-acetyltransferase [Streptomyces sp. NPDC002088]|uniref:GNAT family N-acetyltransferase n=1 Tax=Streptomyces sp. NPDC002088 TaxID=3154665 RepID=UPI00332CC303